MEHQRTKRSWSDPPTNSKITVWEAPRAGRACAIPRCENDELIRQDLSLIFEVIRNKLAAFFIREKAQGRLARNADENRMADFCIAAIQGAMLLGKIKRDSQPAATTVGEALAHLKGYVVAPRRRR